MKVKLYKNMKTGEVKHFTMKGSFEETYIEYVDTEEVLEELEDGTVIYEQEPVEKTRVREFFCHNDKDHFETKEWFEEIFLRFEEVKSVDEIEYQHIRLTNEQKERLAMDEIQRLEERDVSWAFEFVESGEFPVDEEGQSYPNHPLKYLEDKLKLNDTSDQILSGYMELLDLSNASVQVLSENEELSQAVDKLSNNLIDVYQENLELSNTVAELMGTLEDEETEE